MLRKALLGFLVTLGTLLAVEGGLHLVFAKEELLFEWERPSGLIATALDGGVVTRPGAATARQDGPYPWNVRLDAMGFREDAPVPEARPRGVYRVLALGDSWVFGYSVDQGKTIPDQLEQLLPAALGVARVEVINAGVFGSSAFDMLARYRQLVEVYEVDAILLGTPHNSGRFKQTLEQRSAWYRTAHEGPASTLRTYLLARRWLAPLRAGMYAEIPDSLRGDAEHADVRLIVSDARGRGMPAWFAEMPNNLEQGMRGFSGLPAWRKTFEGLGVLTAGHALRERACWGFNDLGHPSEAGAAAIAARVAEAVKAGRSIPVGAEPTCASLPEVGPTKEGWAWAG